MPRGTVLFIVPSAPNVVRSWYGTIDSTVHADRSTVRYPSTSSVLLCVPEYLTVCFEWLLLVTNLLLWFRDDSSEVFPYSSVVCCFRTLIVTHFVVSV